MYAWRRLDCAVIAVSPLLFFWKADAASFVERVNGLSLPGRGVVKALFLSGAEVVPAAGSGCGGGDGGGADGADAVRVWW